MPASPLDSTTAAELFLRAARDAGLAHVVVSPGSRSTPLAVAALRTPDLDYSLHLDERTAAFSALGQAKAIGAPVALICTSGTAAANYLPAVAEASMSHVPLLILTADRPPEHQEWGVGQSFDQRGLYHRQVRAEFTMPVGGDGGENFTQRAGWRAASTAIIDRGPVHVNWAFRMPLEPGREPLTRADVFPAVSPSPPLLVESDVEDMCALLTAADAPVIIAGPDAVDRTQAAALLTDASTLGVPVLADVLSGLRGASGCESLVPAPALVTESAAVQADCVIRIGNTPTAKATRLWWESIDGPHAIVDPLDDWHDPSHRLTRRFRSDPVRLLSAAASRLGSRPEDHASRWRRVGTLTRAAIDERLATHAGDVTEAHIGRSLSAGLGARDLIYASSSMPIRDLDSFGRVTDKPRVLANRGINGIDGVIASGLGASRAINGRTVVHIGDVAVLHDVGSLLDAARRGTNLTIVVPNNDGGGIFSMLPVRSALRADDFAALFHTPHGTNFDFLAGHTAITHQRTTEVERALAETANAPGVSLIEIDVDTPTRVQLQEAIVTAAASIT